jgi:hypothetical protein
LQKQRNPTQKYKAQSVPTDCALKQQKLGGENKKWWKTWVFGKWGKWGNGFYAAVAWRWWKSWRGMVEVGMV